MTAIETTGALAPVPANRPAQRLPRIKPQGYLRRTRRRSTAAAGLLSGRRHDDSVARHEEPEPWQVDARLRKGAVPYAQWPFEPVQQLLAPAPLAPGCKPSPLAPPRATVLESAGATFEWPRSPLEECVRGYELEIAEMDALLGVRPWRQVHRGPAMQATVSFARGSTGLRARVRAYNSHGRGEWSPASLMSRRPAAAPLEKREIDEIPASWLHVDLGGLEDLSEKNDAALLGRTKEELLEALHAQRTAIKVAFRYYALAGVSSVDDDPNTMTMLQFGNFARGCGLVGERLSLQEVDRIFLRAARAAGGSKLAAAPSVEAPNLLSAAQTSKVAVSKEWKKLQAAVGISSLLGGGGAAAKGGFAMKGGGLMAQQQFVGALIRLAAVYLPNPELSLGEKLRRLCSIHVADHVLRELELVNDPFSRLHMASHLLQAVLTKHSHPLRRIFNAYSAADQQSSVAARRALTTMNVRELHSLCDDVELYDAGFTVRDVLVAFVRVNIDDDLYYQASADDSSSELVFDEFEEVVARLFHAAVWRQTQMLHQTASLLDQDGALANTSLA